MMAERQKILDGQFSDLSSTLVGRQPLEPHRIHIRTCFVPVSNQQIELTEDLLNAFRGGDPLVTLGEKGETLDVAFRRLNHGYSPILRGMSREGFVLGSWTANDMFYCSKIIRSDGVLRTDFACRAALSSQNGNIEDVGVHISWFAGYLANTLSSFANVQRLFPSLGNGILRVVIHCSGPIVIASGSGMWSSRTQWPTGTIAVPDFEIEGADSLLNKFGQLQVDIASIPGLKQPAICQFFAN